jgi:hypothetical protein
MVNKKEKGGARLWMRLFACGIPQSTMHSRQCHGLCGRGHYLNIKQVSEAQIAQANEQRIALKAETENGLVAANALSNRSGNCGLCGRKCTGPLAMFPNRTVNELLFVLFSTTKWAVIVHG